MARKKTVAAAEQVGPTFMGATPAVMAEPEARRNLALRETEATARAVAATLGYQLPADCTDPDLIQRDIAINMRRSVEACLEVGRGLAVLRAACEHGNFVARLDVLGVDRHVAARFIQAATKFSNVPTSAHLMKAIGSQSKLLEMLVLDDEQIEELALTGQTGELHLDDVAIMSVKELRAALREEREDKKAVEQIAANRRDELDKLKVKGRRKSADPWPDEVAGLKDDLHGLGKILDEALGKHLTLLDATEVEIDKHADGESNPDALTGYKTVVHHMGEQIERICTLAAGLRSEFETRLAGYIDLDKTHVLAD